MQKRWNILSAEDAKLSALRQDLNIHPALLQILIQRNIDTYEKAKAFFNPDLSNLHSPWLMKDMGKAVDRILTAFNNREKILVFGDYDVDGTTAVACMYSFLKTVYEPSNIEYYIPHRYREGYGVSKAGIDHAHTMGATLIISLDCGIKSIDLVGYAKELGIDFVICDHHTPDAILPPAVAILNPKQADCNYPFKELCGCGVGFKLITALAEKLELSSSAPMEYLDLLATAIAADIVPMVGENRILVYHGLKKANEEPNYGIRALKELGGLQKELYINNLVFMIAPRVNAAGRMDDGSKAVQLFIAKHIDEARQYAAMLHSDNSDRKEADKNITDEALAIISGDTTMVSSKSTVVYQPHWHKGVVGIVASRLIDHYYRPTIVLTQSGEYIAGSARSVAGFNVYEAIHQCRDLLLGYGGHFYAAGMTLEPGKVEAFRARFEEVVSASITEDMLIPEINIDSVVTLSDLKQSFFNIIKRMEPFGPENMQPLFMVSGVTDSGYSKIVKDVHIRFSVKQGNILFNGIGFNLASKFHFLQNGEPVDIVFTLEENEWNNEKHLQLKVLDLRRHEA
ncbi:single-stranded-DNA-specific exonuclease RecJ [Pseudobacter ginsenosidimutans]|uniref:Single-stranded-DNA-specific exonuclease RecJ n=1 Tax=Pseudobacter ginsenosidimutans TaxID=661488 RepID=A0A4Q7MKG0_9BACT|nr:single-stranded-DNA-specific exonuclease RecJ [Pseudobacter ginsenosidimutans]QEC40508.1 single-stranded-DNA-specific exonuclease RecJ [Pseudobacter ginsenosidimutans]RZS68881.1 exonuclease RecJ [Pseudobacter ginsenosidimutans]